MKTVAVVCLGLCFAVVLSCRSQSAGAKRARHIGALQVVEDRGDVWLFIDVHERVFDRAAHASPPYSEHLASQVVARLTNDGLEMRVSIAPGPTFNKTQSAIFKSANAMYLVQRSAGRPIWRWTGRRFERLVPAEEAELKSRIGMLESPAVSIDDVVSRLALAEGWQVILAETQSPSSLSVDCQSVGVRVSLHRDAQAEEIAVDLGKQAASQHIVIERVETSVR